jgi:hypothetical protein
MTAGEFIAEQPAGVGRVNPYFDTPAGRALVQDLLKAGDGRTGDHLSSAIRSVTSSASSLRVDEVDAAIAAIALLLVERAPELLDGAADEPRLRDWIQHVDTELTPGRRLAANGALARIELGLDNEWFEARRSEGTLIGALRALHTLRDELADANGH